MDLSSSETQKVEQYLSEEIQKVKSSNLSDEHKQEKIDILSSTQFIKLGQPLEVGKCNHNYIQDEPNHYKCLHCGIGFQVR